MYWCNEEYDRLHNEALKEFDQDTRTEMYIEMQQIWDEAVHTVWVGYTTLYYAWRADLDATVSPIGRVLTPWFKSK
jgi:ABC-type transport system substrate-binding protein